MLYLLNIALNCVPLKIGKPGTALFFIQNSHLAFEILEKLRFYFCGGDSWDDFCSPLCSTTPTASEEQRRSMCGPKLMNNNSSDTEATGGSWLPHT